MNYTYHKLQAWWWVDKTIKSVGGAKNRNFRKIMFYAASINKYNEPLKDSVKNAAIVFKLHLLPDENNIFLCIIYRIHLCFQLTDEGLRY